jgi:hypothetical protein
MQPVALAWVEAPVMEPGEAPAQQDAGALDGSQEAPAEDEPLKAMCAARAATKAAAATEGQEAAAAEDPEAGAQQSKQQEGKLKVEEDREQESAAKEVKEEL